ncbi:Protein kinase-like domain containing protein [Klebsormidium nitens]|uniref:Protein kinase-like domain containing protein n=1 Tax=Klebsormidium nitens TaxID=105231 RepID=A0A1Y1HSY9_KLENI|nr:Protein kinase-like domain containing protein [Klebsormidium nitens]|eukprot:GAQ81730.1 Protein kinase-like domain containing protein [Klebsormidium nitens]
MTLKGGTALQVLLLCVAFWGALVRATPVERCSGDSGAQLFAEVGGIDRDSQVSHSPPTGLSVCSNHSSPDFLANSCPYDASANAEGGKVMQNPKRSDSLDEGALPQEESRMIVGEAIRELGDGRWGKVYEAEVSGVGRAAVKLLSDAMIEMENDLEMSYQDFRTEAELQQRCQHPNVVKVFGLAPFPSWGNATSRSWGRPDGAVVMEFIIDAQELKDMLEQLSESDGGIPLDFRVSCALDVARGLAHVHAQGVIHFDVKPENILVDRRGSCRLSDFGVAWDPKGAPIRYKGRGSIAYMAPELMLSNKPANTKVDVYSFGILMWKLLIGTDPHDGMDYEEIKATVQRKERPPIDAAWARREPAWHELMTQCWRQPPHARPAMSWVVKSLEKMLE